MAVYSNCSNLVIGLGGTGGRVLREVRKQLFEDYGKIPPEVAFIYIDSSDELMNNNDPSWMTKDGQNAQFSYKEFLNIGTIQPTTIIEHLDSYPIAKEIFGKNNPKMFKYSGPAIGLNRRIGRILFSTKAQNFHSMLLEKDRELSMITGHNGPQTIYIVTSLAGGTESGIIVDVITQTHMRYPYADIFVMVALPTIPPPYAIEHGCDLANVYAALKELNALNVGAFKPLDIMTSGLRVDLNSQEALQFTLIPFENGSIADSLHSFLKNISRRGEHADYFYRTVSYYAPGGRGHWLQREYSTIEINKPVRTQALVGYAQKTILHPKDMILRRISYSMLAQFMRQMAFNNYIDNIGYVKEAQHTYAHYRMVIDHQREFWRIDHKSLTLQRPFPFISHDSYNSFEEEWERLADHFAHDAYVLKNSWKDRYNYLGELYEDYYHTLYRNYGIEVYFNDKISDTYQYAQEICHNIQHDLFMRWYQGEYGINDLIEIVKILIDHLRDENKNAEKRTMEYNELSAKYREKMEFVRMDFAHLNIFRRAFRAKQYLQCYNERLKDYYISLTHIHAIEFEKHLLDKLINMQLELENKLMTISSKLAEMEGEANRIAEEIRKESEGHHNTYNPIVDLSNEDAIQCCIDKLLADKDEMKSLSTLLRQKIAERYDGFRLLENLDEKALIYFVKITKNDIEAFFLSLGNTIVNQKEIKCLSNDLKKEIVLKNKKSGKMPPDMNSVLSVMTTNERIAYMESKDEIVRRFTYNNPFCEDTITALLHRNDSDREQFHQFIYECINRLSVPLQLDEAEFKKTVPYDFYPESLGYTMVFVSLPKPKTGEEERFSRELENTFRTISQNIQISTVETGDEISIASVTTKFPLRFLKSLPELKTCYEQLMSDDKLQASCMLWTEDGLDDLPSLEVEEFVEAPVCSTEDRTARQTHSD